MQPSYMLFDEVTSALDPELVGEVLDTIRKLKKTGMTLVMVTHDISFARESADRVAFFDNGLICELGDARQVVNNPKEERTKQFLQRVLN
ncbi:Glutamine transport ATP-binding protein GlnQ [compost metagenome]